MRKNNVWRTWLICSKREVGPRKMLLHRTELLMQSISRCLAFQPGSGGTINLESKIFVFFFFFSDSSLKFSFRGIPALFSTGKLSFPGRRVPEFCRAGHFALLGSAGAAFYQRQSCTMSSPCVRSVLLNVAGEDDTSFCSKAARNSGGYHPKHLCGLACRWTASIYRYFLPEQKQWVHSLVLQAQQKLPGGKKLPAGMNRQLSIKFQ